MTELNHDQLYCSVDLEFTGFDPSRDQILEIGFAFFKVTKEGYEVVEEWSQVFKPSIDVHPKILGLTGITQEELDNAPEFNEFREHLQEKLGEAIIVGHNPVMDIKFLEAYGLELSGKTIDTLELVQFILPTHHSYNLENLVHYFGVQHHKAHRALGDALSTIQVLENLIRVYQNFSVGLKNELLTVLNREEFLWQELLNFEIAKKELQSNDSLKAQTNKKIEPFILSNNIINVDTVVHDHEARVALGLKDLEGKFVLALPDSGNVMNLWQQGYVHGVFKSEDTFSKKAFDKFLQNANTRDELRFALKVIVWLHTNWQTEVVFDLNISFFGGQFRQFIVGGKSQIKDEKIIALDYSTLQSFVNNSVFKKDRELIVCDVLSFEKFVSAGFGTKLAWNNVLYALRIIYNPETDFGNMQLKDQVLSTLSATDLFFGLVYILLHQNFPNKQYVTLGELRETQEHIFTRLMQAAFNLKTKIISIVDQTQSGELARVATYLENFFEDAPSRVKWITVDEYNSSFHDQPIDISSSTKKLLSQFTKARFTETITESELLFYLADRLGLNTEGSEIPNNIEYPTLDTQLIDGQLSNEEIYNLTTNSALPLVLVMQQPADIKEFYNQHYSEIKKSAALFAQGYSGGGNKMFRNFSIKENSVLLVTADFMAKQNYLISAKNVAFIGLPIVESDHPYIVALLSHWKHKHENLISIFELQKIVGALKKLKLESKVSAKIFKDDKNFSFWG